MTTIQRAARTVPEPVAAPEEAAFTARELDAAEQLVHLSESSSSSGALTRTAGRAPAALRSSSSPRSVNAPPAPAAAHILLGGCADWDWEEGEVARSQRRVKRYRLIAEIYAAMEEI